MAKFWAKNVKILTHWVKWVKKRVMSKEKIAINHYLLTQTVALFTIGLVMEIPQICTFWAPKCFRPKEQKIENGRHSQLSVFFVESFLFLWHIFLFIGAEKSEEEKKSSTSVFRILENVKKSTWPFFSPLLTKNAITFSVPFIRDPKMDKKSGTETESFSGTFFNRKKEKKATLLDRELNTPVD